MFDAEKRALELALKGERVARYIQKKYLPEQEMVWYIHGAVAFKPYQDFMQTDLFSSTGNQFHEMWAQVVDRYQHNPHFFMVPQKEKIITTDGIKLVTMESEDKNLKVLKYVPQADIKPWTGKKWRYVYVPEEYSWKGGVFLILNTIHHVPEAFICPYRKDD